MTNEKIDEKEHITCQTIIRTTGGCLACFSAVALLAIASSSSSVSITVLLCGFSVMSLAAGWFLWLRPLWSKRRHEPILAVGLLFLVFLQWADLAVVACHRWMREAASVCRQHRMDSKPVRRFDSGFANAVQRLLWGIPEECDPKKTRADPRKRFADGRGSPSEEPPTSPLLRAYSLGRAPAGATAAVTAPDGVTVYKWSLLEFGVLVPAAIWYRGEGLYRVTVRSGQPVRVQQKTVHLGTKHVRVIVVIKTCDTTSELPEYLPYENCIEGESLAPPIVYTTTVGRPEIEIVRQWVPDILNQPVYTILNNSASTVYPRESSRTFYGHIERWNGAVFDYYDRGGSCGFDRNHKPIRPGEHRDSRERSPLGSDRPFVPGLYRYVVPYGMTVGFGTPTLELHDYFIIM